jgi:hypothetical protein
LSCATEKGRATLFDAINKRQDDVYRRLYDKFNSLSLVPLNEIKYHRSCYKAYTSNRNLQRYVSDVPECSNTSNNASVSTMKTRYRQKTFVDKRLSRKIANLSALKAANSFIHGCFKENETMDFYSPISRSQLETFEDLTKRCNLKCRSGEVIKAHINTEIVFKRALALANVREEVTVEKVLACPIGQIPTALFHDDGLMRKSCKSDLINLLGVHTS